MRTHEPYQRSFGFQGLFGEDWPLAPHPGPLLDAYLRMTAAIDHAALEVPHVRIPGAVRIVRSEEPHYPTRASW